MFKTLDEMIRTDEFQAYQSDKTGNDLFINDPDRADRIHEAAENGSDGSTHQEIMEDWRDFLGSLSSYEIDEETREAIEKEIDDCEEWHVKNGSIDTQLS